MQYKINKLINLFLFEENKKEKNKEEINLLFPALKGMKVKDIKEVYKNALLKLDKDEPLNDKDKDAIAYMFKTLSNNTKTQFAIDFMPGSKATGGTCYMSCSYCYVLKSFKIGEKGKVLKRKYMRLTKLIQKYPDVYEKSIKRILKNVFAETDVDAIRWFGSGDYQPYMKDIMISLVKTFPDKKFYVMSKTLTFPDMEKDLFELLKYGNIYINLSFHKNNKDVAKKLYPLKKKYPNLRFAYTLDEFEGVRIYKVTYDENGKIIKKEEQDINAYVKKELEKRFKVRIKSKEKTERLKRENPEEYKKKSPVFNKKEKQIGWKDKSEWGWSLSERSLSEQSFLKQARKNTKLIIEMIPEYMEFLKMFDEIFNVNRKSAFRLAYYKSGLAFCECDMEMMYKYRACVKTCKRCFSANKESAVKIFLPIKESFGDTETNEIIVFIMEEIDLKTIREKISA